MGRSVTTKIVSTVAGRTGDVSLAITDVNGAAPLESPTLTGIPKAPTAAAGTSTTQIATTEFVSNIAMSAGSVSITNAAPAAEAVGVSSALGSSSAAARSDHVHAMPGVATATAAGFMSAADKVRLDATAPLDSPTFTGTASFEYIENKPEFLAYGEDGGGLMFQLPTAGTTLTGDIIIDSTKDVVRIYESGGDQRGLSFDLDEYSPSAGTRFSKSDHTHTDATINASGLMSAVDKTKLNGIAASAAALGTSAGTSLATSAAVGSATTAAKSDHVHPLPTLATLGAAAAAHSHDLSNASVKYADSAGRAHPVREDGVNINFNWTSKTGQPQWVWGANDGQDETNYYVYNPSGFSVDTAHNLRPGANQGIVWDDDAFGGGGDTASILLESGGGEDLAMMFRLTNDATDVFRFWNASSGTDVPGVTHHNDGMTLNGHVILNAANYDNYAPSRLRRSDGGDPYYLQHKWSATPSLWRLDGYKPDGAFHAGVEVARADSAKNVDSVPWTSVTGTPSTYAPSAHAHDYAANASPVFTGNPTSPTPNQFDKDTSIATTAFVQRALGNLQGSMVLNAPHSLTWADCGKLVLLGQTQQVSGTIFLPGIIVTDGSDESEDGRTFYIYNASNNSDYKLDCGDIWLHGSPYVWITHTETIKPGEYWTITAARGHYYATVTYDGPSLGIRQTWQVFSAFERVSGVTYENTSSSPISVMITCPDTGGDSPSVRVTVNGTVITEYVYDYGGNFGQCTVSFVVPKGAEYKAELLNTIYGFQKWVELR